MASVTASGVRRRVLWLTVVIAVSCTGGTALRATEQAAIDYAALAHRDPRVREEAVRVLGTHGDRALGELLRALFDPDRRVRKAAVEALTDVGGARALEVLAAAVHDADARLRENVAYAAGRIGGRGAAPVVELLLADPVEAVREAARAVLGDLSTRAGRSEPDADSGRDEPRE
jgi:HEAT repeat protein